MMSFASILFAEIDWLSVPGLVLEEANVTLSCHYNVSADKASTPHIAHVPLKHPMQKP